MEPNLPIAISASIIGLLGLAHLVLTYHGPKLLPRDAAVREAMRGVAPVITTQTDLWRMWIGFNVSHSMGALLFGLVYGHLALVEADLLAGSMFLQMVGLAMLAGFVVLARRYWFVTPFVGSSVALLSYVLGLVQMLR